MAGITKAVPAAAAAEVLRKSRRVILVAFLLLLCFFMYSSLPQDLFNSISGGSAKSRQARSADPVVMVPS